MKTHDRIRETKFIRPVPRPEIDQCQANRHPKEKAIAADKIGFKTWTARWWNGRSWEFVKASRCPKINSKFMTRSSALAAAQEQLFFVNNPS